MEQAYNVFLLLGGIGLFLFGISYMGKGLEQAAGDNLRVWLEKLTTSPLKAVLVGALATAAIQSSGATMVMAVGFVNAEMMTLSQALYIMLGASIGTTITAQIIALDIDPWAPLILFIGIVLTQFIKNRTAKKAGAIVLGFGILFVGINLMGDAVKAMELGGLVGNFLHNVHNPVLSLLFGAVFTLVIQSSSAAVGILQVIVASSLGATMGLEEVVYMIMGMNVGAVAPLVISSLSGNRLTKRAAAAQTAVKLLSAITFSILMLLIPAIVNLVKGLSPNDVSRQVANFHTIYNSVSAVLMFPLIKPVAKIAEKVMPDAPGDELFSRKLLYVTNDLSKSPAIMITQAHAEMMRFADVCRTNLHTALESFFERDEDKAELVIEREKTINFLSGQPVQQRLAGKRRLPHLHHAERHFRPGTHRRPGGKHRGIHAGFGFQPGEILGRRAARSGRDGGTGRVHGGFVHEGLRPGRQRSARGGERRRGFRGRHAGREDGEPHRTPEGQHLRPARRGHLHRHGERPGAYRRPRHEHRGRHAGHQCFHRRTGRGSIKNSC